VRFSKRSSSRKLTSLDASFFLVGQMFPFASHPIHGYSLSTLPRAMENLAEAGKIAKKYNMRITAHPGQW